MPKALLAPIAQIPRFNKSGQPINVMAEDGCGVACAKPEYDFDILTRAEKTRYVNPCGFWDDEEWDFNKYDLVVVYPQVPPFYGGLAKAHLFKYINALIRYEGPIVQFQHDPIHKNFDFLKICYRRLFVQTAELKFDPGYSRESVDKQLLHDNIWKTDQENTYTWSAFPAEKGFNERWCDWEFVDGFRKTFSEVREQENTLFREEGICYVGVKRPERVKKLEELCADGLVEFLGPISGQGKSVQIPDANSWMRGYTHTLIIGDKKHSDLGVNHRLLQGLAAECICLIDINLDPNKKLILDPELRDALYFDGAAEFHAKYQFTSENYEYIMDLQNKEATRVFSESSEDLMKRINR